LPDNPDGVLFTSSAGLFYSISGGRDWIKDETFPEDFYGRDIDFAQTNSCWLIGDKGYLFRSTNAGGIILSAEEENFPTEYRLFQNYPNPFNPSTKIKFTVPAVNRSFTVTLRVCNILGEEVAMLLNENFSPGEYEIDFSADNLPSGIYFYQLSAGEFKQTKKMILLR
ncbi:MAG: T9SS type A sorting domain-containing protein, partial [Melioribacteraceae bacterium]|nr:T9SS type A sorting domain-containing protein [Melioribacteraceae bacterium]